MAQFNRSRTTLSHHQNSLESRTRTHSKTLTIIMRVVKTEQGGQTSFRYASTNEGLTMEQYTLYQSILGPAKQSFQREEIARMTAQNTGESDGSEPPLKVGESVEFSILIQPGPSANGPVDTRSLDTQFLQRTDQNVPPAQPLITNDDLSNDYRNQSQVAFNPYPPRSGDPRVNAYYDPDGTFHHYPEFEYSELGYALIGNLPQQSSGNGIDTTQPFGQGGFNPNFAEPRQYPM